MCIRDRISVFVLILALSQLGIDTAILVTAVTIMIAAFGLAIALALGLGARSIVLHVLAGFYLRQRFVPGIALNLGKVNGSVDSIGSAVSYTHLDVYKRQVFIKVFRNLKTLHDPALLSAWITRIAINTCMDAIARQQRRPTMVPLAPIGHDGEVEEETRYVDTHIPTPEEAVLRLEVRQCLEKAMLHLDGSAREALIPVSYTHLDVYKRQLDHRPRRQWCPAHCGMATAAPGWLSYPNDLSDSRALSLTNASHHS